MHIQVVAAMVRMHALTLPPNRQNCYQKHRFPRHGEGFDTKKQVHMMREPGASAVSTASQGQWIRNVRSTKTLAPRLENAGESLLSELSELIPFAVSGGFYRCGGAQSRAFLRWGRSNLNLLAYLSEYLAIGDQALGLMSCAQIPIAAFTRSIGSGKGAAMLSKHARCIDAAAAAAASRRRCVIRPGSVATCSHSSLQP